MDNDAHNVMRLKRGTMFTLHLQSYEGQHNDNAMSLFGLVSYICTFSGHSFHKGIM